MHPPEEDLRRYLDEELGEAERAAIAAHFQDCPRCLEALQAMGEEGAREIADALRLRPPSPPRFRPQRPTRSRRTRTGTTRRLRGLHRSRLS
jgi:anti-sigma factor RsiW